MTNTLFEMTTEPATSRLARRVRAEYFEMPGLSLTMPQAQRLWGLDRQSCAVVLNALIRGGVLRRTAQGMYVRA